MEFCCKKMVTIRRVKPVVNQICNTGSVKQQQQATVLRAIIDHHDLAAACELAGIDSTKKRTKAKSRAICLDTGMYSALVEQYTYKSYTMDDTPPILNYEIEFPKEKFYGML